MSSESTFTYAQNDIMLDINFMKRKIVYRCISWKRNIHRDNLAVSCG